MNGQSPSIYGHRTNETTMEVLNSTRVKAPASNMPQTPLGQQIAEHYDVLSAKPFGRSDAPPEKRGTPYRAPIGRDGTDKPVGRPALFSTKSLIGIGTWNVRTLH